MRFRPCITQAAVLFQCAYALADEAPAPTLELVTDPVQFASWIPNRIRGASKIEISEDGKDLTLEAPAGERLDLLLRCPPQQPDLQALQGQWAPASVGNTDPRAGVLAYQRSLPMPGFDRGLWEFGLNVPPWPGTELSGRFACVAIHGNQEPIQLSLRLLITEGGATVCARQEFAVVSRTVPEDRTPVMVSGSGGVSFIPGESNKNVGTMAAVEVWWFPGEQTLFSIGGAYLAAEHWVSSEEWEGWSQPRTEVRHGEAGEVKEVVERDAIEGEGDWRRTTQTNMVLAQAGYHGLFDAETPWFAGGIDLGIGMKYAFSTRVDAREHSIQASGGVGSALLIAPGFQFRAGGHWRFPARVSWLILGEQPDHLAFTAGVAYLP